MATAHMSDVNSERLNNVDPLICKSYGHQKDLNYFGNEK
jgi:hypothetical protein